MSTRIFLVRHGATTQSREDYFCGATDVPLSDQGRSQAASLAERLENEKFAAAYSSDLQRTVVTASIIAKPHGLAPIARPALREINHGRWEGKQRKQVEVDFAEEYATWEADPFGFAPQGGEAGVSVLARALPALRQIVTDHAGSSVLVVSHKATIRLIVSSLLGFDMRGYRDRLEQHPACLNILDFKDASRARLMLYNDISHYEGLPAQASARLSKWWDSEAKK